SPHVFLAARFRGALHSSPRSVRLDAQHSMCARATPHRQPTAGMSMEIEAKYAILGPLNPAVLTALDLSPYAVHPDGEQHHQDVVLDTPAHTITSSGQALRLRQCEGQVTLTYKGPNTGADGVHEREEVEATLPEPVGFDPHTWPRQVAERIVPLVGREPLAPLV